MTSYAPGRGLAGVRLLAIGLLMLACSFVACGPRQITATPPGEVLSATPYVRLATYNAILAESNYAAAKAVRSAADIQLIPVTTAREIFAWQERVAKTNKTLAVVLSDSAVDIKSSVVTNLVLELAAPPLLDRWMADLSKPEQQLLLSSLRSLANTVALVLREFTTKQTALLQAPEPIPRESPPGQHLQWQHPRAANPWAYAQSVEAERVLGVTPAGVGQRSAAMELASLWMGRKVVTQ